MSDEPKPEKSFNFENAFNVLQERCIENADQADELNYDGDMNTNFYLLLAIKAKAQNIIDIVQLCTGAIIMKISNEANSDEPEPKPKPIPKLCSECGELVQDNICIKCGCDYSEKVKE